MLENPDPVMVSSESSNPHDGTEVFFGPEVISTLSMTGVRQVADLNKNLSVTVGSDAQPNVSTTVQSEDGENTAPEAPVKKFLRFTRELNLRYLLLSHGRPPHLSG